MRAYRCACFLLIVATLFSLVPLPGQGLPAEYRQKRFLKEWFDGLEENLDDVVKDLTTVLKVPTSNVLHSLEDLGKNLHKWTTKLEDMGTKVVGGILSKLTPTEYLEKFGYLHKTVDGKHGVGTLIQALTKFQKMFHKSTSGLLDTDTIHAMLQPRCGMPDLLQPIMENVKGIVSGLLPVKNVELEKRYDARGPKWSKTNLAWKIHNYYESTSISSTTQHDAIKAGLQYWQDVSGLKFSETTSTADINFKFVTANHGDGTQNAFDGPGGVLAHAFFPQSGECHYDNTEEWTDGQSRGINLKIVTAHEIGHALGLGHSEVKGALMGPYYQGFVANYQLPQDDIDGIQKLYGPNTANVSQPRTTPPVVTLRPTPAPTTVKPNAVAPVTSGPTSGQPNSCTIAFRAVVQIHTYQVYIFNGDWAWRISDVGLDAGFPQRINTIYPGAPSNIEGAVFSPQYYLTYFFKGNTVWVYYGYESLGYKTIKTTGFPTVIQTAVLGPDQIILLIDQNSNVYVFNEDNLDITTAAPRKIWDVFPGAPYAFDSIFRFQGDTTLFFFKGDYYYKYSETYKTQMSGFPKAKAVPWFGSVCQA